MKNLNLTLPERSRKPYFASIYQSILLHRLDITITLLLAILVGVACFCLAHWAEAVRHIDDIWFRGDCSLVYRMMVEPEADTYRRIRHPLFPIVAPLFVFVFSAVFGLTSDTAVTVVLALTAAFWMGAMFSLLRLIGCPRLDAILLSLLGIISAASLFWFTVPESYGMGSLTIMLGLLFAALAERQSLPMAWYLAINVVTISITVTNWMVAVITTLLHQTRLRALQVFASTLGLVAVPMVLYRLARPYLFGASQTLVKASPLPHSLDTVHHTSAVARMLGLDFLFQLNPISVVQAFFSHTLLMPAFKLDVTSALYTQDSLAASANAWNHWLLFLWLGLLLLGSIALFKTPDYRAFRRVVGITLALQLLLHLLFGDETFLFTLHFIPLFIVLVALACRRHRTLVLAITCLLIIGVSSTNIQQFEHASYLLQTSMMLQSGSF